MNYFWVVLILSLVVFLVRFSGFWLNRAEMSPFWARFCRYIPLGAFTALVTANLSHPDAHLWPKLVAAGAAVALTFLSKKLWLGMLGGLGAFWFLLWLISYSI
jgi:branched-subunit amino acid transport protein